MQKKMYGLSLGFIILMILTLGIYCLITINKSKVTDNGEQVIAWNEVEQLLKNAEKENDITMIVPAIEKVKLNKKLAKQEQQTKQVGNLWPVMMTCVTSLVLLLFYSSYVNFNIIRPFDKLKVFARQIAAGNFDIPLNFERKNYFGDFTWAFDSMRKEVTKARALEKEAIENNKIVIATLSHDIKTPIASIRAYAEGLEANLDSQENREMYLQVIMKKCDEVAKLTNDLLLHSIADLEKLRMQPEKIHIYPFLKEMIKELNSERGDLAFTSDLNEKEEEELSVMMDRKRLIQVMENLVNNARKYAKSEVNVRLSHEDSQLTVIVSDHGPGIPDADVPFIFDKFYRGKNSVDQQGSGLGLYIVRYIMQQSKGSVCVHNRKKGLEVILVMPVIS